ncbi:MAG: hypothetical protein ACI9L9_002672, partial [Marivirga sp.]
MNGFDRFYLCRYKNNRYKLLTVIRYITNVNQKNRYIMSNSNKPGEGSYSMNSSGGCPFHGGSLKQVAGGGTTNRDWWPNQLK